MNEVIKMARKAVTGAVVAATIAWSVSLSAFLAPLAAHAATSGSLVKASLPAVYYVGSDGKRYVFPNEKTYKTWYADFSSVMTITDSELAAMSIGGNVTYKPGVKMVKITTDPKVYAVDAHGTLRWVNSEALATALYGANWNQHIEDVPDAFFTNYTVGSDISSASQFSPASASAAATSINQDKNLGSSTTVSGTLSVMLSSGQPAGGTLPGGAMGVNVLKLDVRNGGSSAATVDTLTVHRSGAGNTTDIANLYVYAGNDRLTTGRSINSSSNDVAFSGLNLSLASGETKTVWIAADISTGALGGNQHSFSLTDLRSGSAMASGLPLSGPTFTMSSADVGEITISKTGSITNPKAGEAGAKIASFKLDVGTQEDVTFNRIALFQAGSISRDKLSNFVLKQAGLTIATVSSANSKDLIVFALSNPMTLEKGNSRTFDVYADIAGSARTIDTIQIYLDQQSDLSAVGKTYGYGVMVINTLYDGATCPSDCSNSTVDAGQLTITYNGPAAHDVATNAKDVELFNFTMAAQSNLEVRKTMITLDSTGGNLFATTARLTDVKITDTATGSVVAGPFDVSTAGPSETHTFTEVYNLSAGQARTFKVTADIANNAPNGMTVKVTLGTFTAPGNSNAVRNLDNSTYVSSDVVPNSTISGNQHTIKTSTLTVSAASTPVAQTYIQGSQNIELAAWGFKSGDSQAVKVTDLTVRCYIDAADGNGDFNLGTDVDPGTTAVCSDDVLSAKLWNGSTQVGTTKSPTNGGLLQFTNLNLDVPAGQTVTLKLTGNLSSSIPNINTSNDRLIFRVTPTVAGPTANDVIAQDADGNSILANLGDFDGQTMTISSAGTFTVTKASDDTESEAGLVVGGSSNVVLAKYRFNAVNEDLKLAKARFHVATPNGVTSLSLYDGATLVGGPVSVDGNGDADFSGMSAFVIPKDGNRTLTVKANLSSVGSSGTTTGSDLMVTLCSGNNTCPGAADAGTFEVRGTSAGSSTVLNTAAADVGGNSKIARKSKPTVTLVSLPSTTLSAGNQVVLRFTVSADAANDIALGELTADVTTSGFGVTVNCVGGCGAANTTTLKRVGGDYLSANVTYAAQVLTITLDAEETISAGTSKTYEVHMTTATPDPSDSVSSTLRSDLLNQTGTFAAVSGARNFVWSDMSATSHDFTTADWASGFKVKTLPTDSQTLVK